VLYIYGGGLLNGSPFQFVGEVKSMIPVQITPIVTQQRYLVYGLHGEEVIAHENELKIIKSKRKNNNANRYPLPAREDELE
jgi:hypothetical protein